MSDSVAPCGQAKYQVRFDWGVAGAERILPGAHVVVVVDVLPSTGGEARGEVSGEAIAAGLADRDVVVLAASLRNRTAVARRILELQEQSGERLLVAIIAAGEAGGDELRFTIEDQLGAGAVVDALIALGIDHTSPEAAVACAAFEGLRHAATHLIGASGSAVGLVEQGRRPEVRSATEIDVSTDVPVLGDGDGGLGG
ncbi:2-phosphosulfolactate phosphatase [Agromyces sp. NPDC058484]|uniref:2-phosphosulfolactate phosphatase n=1 Tax=Agromyces sp. NPDC058484 TaxID=3346524 RepID=UPI0036492FCB